MDWTEERVGLLRNLWTQGCSASEIAARLGGVTRNAVIGKAHRLGLSARASPIQRELPRPAAPGRACLWPVGDPKQAGFHFCNAPIEPGRPYCPAHCAVAYNRRTDAAA